MRHSKDGGTTRRTVMGAAGTAVAAGIAMAIGPERAAAAESTVGQECMTIVYRSAPGVRFDFDYYENTHMPLIMRLYGDSISRFELRRGPPDATYVATISIWIADGEAFDRAAAEHQARIRADVDKFTNAELIAQRDRVTAISSR